MNSLYVKVMEAEKKSQNTIKAYTTYINGMLNYINKPEEDQITYADLIDWRANLDNNLSSSSIALRIAAVKSYFNFLYDNEIITKNPSIKLKAPKVQHTQKHYMDNTMIHNLISCAKTLRDKAIFALFCTTGLRVSELTNITLDQYKNMKGEDGREIVIEGKGSKKRTIYVNDMAKEAIDNYLNSNPRRNSDCDKLFVSFQGGIIHSNNLSHTIKTAAKKAGIPFWNELSNHCLRAAFATIASANGVPVPTISAAMGHSNINTTMIYIKNSQEQINNTMKGMVF